MKFYLAPFLFLLGSLPLAAQGEEPMKEMTLITILEMGGWVMVVLGFMSLLVMILILLFFLTLRRSTVVTGRYMNSAEAMIRKRDYLGLIAYSHRRGEAVARVTGKTLDFLTKNPNANHVDIREVAEAEASRQSTILTQRVSYLADIGAIAPMVGLLGTVIGMIRSFIEIGKGNFEGVQQMQMANGIWEAMITTAAGLIVSIIALSFYSLFRGRVQRLISDLETASTHILAVVSGQLSSRQTVSYQSDPSVLDDYVGNGPSPMRSARHD